MANPDLFYTYIYYDPSRNNEPIYVGKGFGRRVWKHPFTQRIQFMKKNSIKPTIGIYAGLDEEFSLLLEEELIAKFGRKDLGLGSLLNLTDGGDVGPTGMKPVFTEDHKKKLSKASKGKKKSEEARHNMSIAKKGKPSGRKGRPNPMKKSGIHGNTGKIRSQEFKDNLIGRKQSIETKEKRRTTLAGMDLTQPIVAYPHCGKQGGEYTMPRWHFDRCKLKGKKEND
jgi:hypothetical protein